MLPGNAGRDLRFERSYNSKGSPAWRFGIAGVPMFVEESAYPPTPPFNPDTAYRPRLVTADGTEHRTAWLEPTSSNAGRWVVTSLFWRYDRSNRMAYLPDGTVCRYDTNGRLIHVADAFGNIVTLTWDTGPFGFGAGTLVVQQFLGAEQTRTVTLAVNNELPVSMAFNGSTWTYA